jgi:DNA-binding IclR family transcriptional regulator
MDNWTFLTNYGHVFLCIAADPGIRLLDVATKVGITERSAQRIVADLIEEGYLTQTKVGRRNRYKVRADLPLRHPLEKQNAVGTLLQLLDRRPKDSASGKKRQPTRAEIVSPHS